MKDDSRVSPPEAQMETQIQATEEQRRVCIHLWLPGYGSRTNHCRRPHPLADVEEGHFTPSYHRLVTTIRHQDQAILITVVPPLPAKRTIGNSGSKSSTLHWTASVDREVILLPAAAR